MDVQIQSLSKSGGEFYFGEKVPVWAETEGDKQEISYEWSTTGGSFDGWRTQNLFENLWIAPNVAGEYTVTATAKNEGTTSTRSTNMKVTRYFFDEFQSAYTLTGNGWTTSNTTNALENDTDPTLSTLELTASSSSKPNIRRSLNLADLKIPFSVRTQLGWKDEFLADSSITVSLFFVQPTDPTIPYLREIRWDVWPTVDTASDNNYRIGYETFIPATNTSKFSTYGNAVPDPLPLTDSVNGKRADLTMADGQTKNLSFSVDADNVFHAYIDGTLWFSSNGIRDWLTYAKATYTGFEDPLAKEYRVAFPTKKGTASTIFLKSVYINNDGEILK